MSNPKLLLGRRSAPDAHYSITIVVRSRQPIFFDQALAQVAIAELRSSAVDDVVDSIAWVVMPDHLHWLFALRQGDLSSIVQAVKSRISRAINAHNGSTGSVWQAGFYDHRLRNDEDLRKQASYIIANPLRRRLVVRLDDYPHWWCRWVQNESDL